MKAPDRGQGLDEAARPDVDYSDLHEAEKLMGHYLLLVAMLGSQPDVRLELARRRIRQRRRDRALAGLKAAIAAS